MFLRIGYQDMRLPKKESFQGTWNSSPCTKFSNTVDKIPILMSSKSQSFYFQSRYQKMKKILYENGALAEIRLERKIRNDIRRHKIQFLMNEWNPYLIPLLSSVLLSICPIMLQETFYSPWGHLHPERWWMLCFNDFQYLYYHAYMDLLFPFIIFKQASWT